MSDVPVDSPGPSRSPGSESPAQRLSRQNQWLQLLSEAAAELLTATDPGQMVRAVFERVKQRLNVDLFFNFMLDRSGQAMRLDCFGGLDESTARSLGRVRLGDMICGSVALRRTRIVAERLQDGGAVVIDGEDKADGVRAMGVRAYACHPLLAGNRLVGTLSFGSKSRDRFSEEELRFMQSISHYLAIAKERLLLLREADMRAARVQRLQEVTEAMSQSLSVTQVARVLVEQGLSAMGAAGGSVGLLSADGRTVDLAAHAGYEALVIQQWSSVPLDAPVSLAESVRLGQPVFLRNQQERLSRFPALMGLSARRPTIASACIPLEVDGRVIGAMGLSFDDENEFPEEDRRFMAALARQAAQAIQRARLFEAERRSREEAERASRAKDEFIAVLSHELRTPLTPVLLTASLMESHPELPEQFREDVAAIRRNVELESRLIGDLLDLTRIARGKLQLDPEPVDLHLLIRSAADICQRESSARLMLELEAGDSIVHGDPTRLQQVFWNLINNAVKFSRPDSPVVVRTDNPPEGGIIARVVDLGAGIDPAVLPRLFNAFEQGDVRLKRQQAGLGLGLAISRRLVEAHGGSIGAQSGGLGQGAVFSVTMPTLPGHSPAPAAPAAGELDSASSPSLHILLVEDNDQTTRAMVKLLDRLGCRVTTADSLGAARSILARSGAAGFDLLFCDLGLPDGSGLELARELDPRHRSRAVALTGYGMEQDVQRSRDAGFARHLTKPVSARLLAQTIRGLTDSESAPG